MTAPEEQARQNIDALLTAARWAVQDFKADQHPRRARRAFAQAQPVDTLFLDQRSRGHEHCVAQIAVVIGGRHLAQRAAA